MQELGGTNTFGVSRSRPIGPRTLAAVERVGYPLHHSPYCVHLAAYFDISTFRHQQPYGEMSYSKISYCKMSYSNATVRYLTVDVLQ